MKWIGYAIYGMYVLTIFWLLITALMQLHLLWHTRRKKEKLKEKGFSPLPFVTIQVPVYNEKYVAEGLLQSLSALQYPSHLFEIQVLDDSADETSFLIDQQAVLLKKKGINVSVLRRPGRKGYKAGALQHGLPACKGELIAIFDADFRPPSLFLNNLVSHFTDAQVGFLQARWGHLNGDQNFLTRIQTFLLDTHFNVEQAGRYRAGYFTNFCGTAGIWRKRCIEEAGGWDGEVLSEDLDLSYRAQLKGWKAAYTQEMEVPAELPNVMEAFKIQQFRWSKGMAQVAKKTLGPILKQSLPLDKKLHAFFHLLGSVMFLCLFINALLTVPLLLLRNHYPEFIRLTDYTAVGAFNLVALTLLHYKGTGAANKGIHFLTYYPLFLLVFLGISVQNGIAVLQGLFGVPSAFMRTPKFSLQRTAGSSYLNNKVTAITIIETFLLCYFICGIGMSFYFTDYYMLLFFVMITLGLGILVYQALAALNMKSFFIRVWPKPARSLH